MPAMRVRSVLAAAFVAVLAWSGASAGPLTQDACSGSATVAVWKQLGSDVLENLLFADGSLWISDSTAGAIRRFDPAGAEMTGLPGVSSPGGLALGPDGLIYAGEGNAAAQAILRTGAARVIRFDAASPSATEQVYASGFNMPNGMTFGPNDDLFVSNDFDVGLVRIPRSDPSSWSVFADVWGTNGLVVDPAGTNLYAAITFDQRSPIERIPLANPASHETAVQLSFGVASLQPAVHTDPDASAPLAGVKGLDDMTRDADGVLYVVANGTGELIRVDPSTGAACLIASGLRNPSSVRIAPPEFAAGEATTTFFVTEFSGAIRRIVHTP